MAPISLERRFGGWERPIDQWTVGQWMMIVVGGIFLAILLGLSIYWAYRYFSRWGTPGAGRIHEREASAPLVAEREAMPRPSASNPYMRPGESGAKPYAANAFDYRPSPTTEPLLANIPTEPVYKIPRSEAPGYNAPSYGPGGPVDPFADQNPFVDPARAPRQ